MAVIRLGNLLWRPHTRPISPEDPVDVKDVNTADIKAKLEMAQSELARVKAELQEIKANQLSGDQKVTLKDASGAVVSPATEAKLEQVRALLSGVATENKLEQARTLLEAISTKDFATSSKQDTLKIAVEDLKSELNLVKSELANIKANQLSGDQKVQLSGTLTELEQAIVLLDAISGKDFATQTTLAAVLAKLADLESELATIKANQLSGDQKVQLSGTMTERYGADVNSRPLADTVPTGATFTIVDESGYFQTWISDGTKWVEV